MEKTQWHPAFCAAMQLELRGIKTLTFDPEYTITKLPTKTDLLIINKEPDVKIDNQIGEFFKGHNILEYKAPTDHKLSESAIIQAMAYACYYSLKENTLDVTATLVVSKSHFNLIKWLDKQGISYKMRHDGIYDVELMAVMDFQIVITEELDKRAFTWLSALTDHITEPAARAVVTSAHGMGQEGRYLAGQVVQVITSVNKEMFDKVREEDKSMASALMELMKKEVDEVVLENKVTSVVSCCKRFGGSKEDAIQELLKSSEAVPETKITELVMKAW